jgi:hypothetical protein
MPAADTHKICLSTKLVCMFTQTNCQGAAPVPADCGRRSRGDTLHGNWQKPTPARRWQKLGYFAAGIATRCRAGVHDAMLTRQKQTSGLVVCPAILT